MGTLNEDLSAIKEVEDKIVANKVARFAYTYEAYRTNDADGVDEYDVDNAQNIPTADASVLKVNETVLSKGYRAQASSITRMLVNHFFGRMSYNLNKVNDNVSNLIATLIGHRGTANGFATLDASGRIPYSQLPESAMEYKGQWNAETNTPTLADGNGTKGDFYVVSVSGTQNIGSGNIQFFVNDRVIYDGSVWSRLSAGDVKTVNNISPENGNVALTGENIPVSPTDPTLLSAPLTTERIADNAVTNAKIKDPVSVAKGGTGATGAKDAFMNLANGLSEGSNPEGSNPEDTEHIIYKNGLYWGLYTFSTVWNYIKSKISSVLGLTATQYNGNAKTATHADSATYATHADTADTADRATRADTADRATHADTADTANKVKNALTINGTPFDGSTPVTFNTSDTDTKVTQTVSTTDNNYPILATATANKNYSSTETAIFSPLVSMNPLTGNMTGWSNGSAYAICATSSSVQLKNVVLPGLTLTAGMTITVFFYYGNTADLPKLTVNSSIVEAPIKLYFNRNKTTITTQWDPGTSMTLMYDGTDFVVLGNPIVMLAHAETYNYIKYANGLIIQWDYVVKDTPKDATETITFPISYIQTPALNATWIINANRYTRMTINSISTTQAVIRNTDGTTNGYTWMSIGY